MSIGFAAVLAQNDVFASDSKAVFFFKCHCWQIYIIEGFGHNLHGLRKIFTEVPTHSDIALHTLRGLLGGYNLRLLTRF